MQLKFILRRHDREDSYHGEIVIEPREFMFRVHYPGGKLNSDYKLTLRDEDGNELSGVSKKIKDYFASAIRSIIAFNYPKDSPPQGFISDSHHMLCIDFDVKVIQDLETLVNVKK